MAGERTDSAGGARLALIETGIRSFGRSGFGVGLREVALEAGLTAGSITYFFGGKKGLVAACDEHVMAEVRAQLPAILSSRKKTARLRGDAQRHLANLEYLMRALRESPAVLAEMEELLTGVACRQLEHASTTPPDRVELQARAAEVVRRSLGIAMLDHALEPPRTAADLAAFVTSSRDLSQQLASELATDSPP
ncbi:TetR family transcriptional regulator [Ruania suaedae]|uniref:TetR/AcrR family transcriptional regulator n=1 Tax=Ruania suaedae TaxID=2897774 RepID=UPI001E3AE330|nr:TetR family transcriptional regulator [Ruania suaedae]UFU02187.1 TetR family transcriptional regulator [Ruania suaedae]